jgi:hypothetical protein
VQHTYYNASVEEVRKCSTCIWTGSGFFVERIKIMYGFHRGSALSLKLGSYASGCCRGQGAYKQTFYEIEFFAIKIKMDFL